MDNSNISNMQKSGESIKNEALNLYTKLNTTLTGIINLLNNSDNILEAEKKIIAFREEYNKAKKELEDLAASHTKEFFIPKIIAVMQEVEQDEDDSQSQSQKKQFFDLLSQYPSYIEEYCNSNIPNLCLLRKNLTTSLQKEIESELKIQQKATPTTKQKEAIQKIIQDTIFEAETNIQQEGNKHKSIKDICWFNLQNRIKDNPSLKGLTLSKGNRVRSLEIWAGRYLTKIDLIANNLKSLIGKDFKSISDQQTTQHQSSPQMGPDEFKKKTKTVLSYYKHHLKDHLIQSIPTPEREKLEEQSALMEKIIKIKNELKQMKDWYTWALRYIKGLRQYGTLFILTDKKNAKIKQKFKEMTDKGLTEKGTISPEQKQKNIEKLKYALDDSTPKLG
jgi:hypothetical protein